MTTIFTAKCTALRRLCSYSFELHYYNYLWSGSVPSLSRATTARAHRDRANISTRINMLSIEKVVIEECKDSQFVRPFRLSFIRDGKKKKWDLIKSHDSVAILLHHTERKSLLFVRQFRPAVYYNRVYEGRHMELPPVGTPIDGDIKLGLTVELCAGIVDKNVPNAQIAVEEVHEECGFKVPIEKLEKIATFWTNIGISGCEQTMYYAEVTESMRSGPGGGLVSEEEYIETVEVPISRARDMLFDESIASPTGCAFAVMWFLKEKYRPSLGEVLRDNGFDIAVLASGISVLAMITALSIHMLR